jgi:hypothetical protein
MAARVLRSSARVGRLCLDTWAAVAGRMGGVVDTVVALIGSFLWAFLTGLSKIVGLEGSFSGGAGAKSVKAIIKLIKTKSKAIINLHQIRQEHFTILV